MERESNEDLEEREDNVQLEEEREENEELENWEERGENEERLGKQFPSFLAICRQKLRIKGAKDILGGALGK